MHESVQGTLREPRAKCYRKRIGVRRFMGRAAEFSQCVDLCREVYDGAGRMLAIERFVRKDLPAEGRILTVRRSVQRALGENIELAAGIGVLQKKKAEGCKVYRTDSHPARKWRRGM